MPLEEINKDKDNNQNPKSKHTQKSSKFENKKIKTYIKEPKT